MTSISSQLQDAIEISASLIREAHHAIVITGAGLSTPSGIPDFRSEGTGLWSKDEPLEVASLLSFRLHPEVFFEWIRPLAWQIYYSQPNQAHYALTELEKLGYIKAILTQNIDALHQKSGAKRVLELHGTFGTLSCTQCYRQYSREEFLLPFIDTGSIPRCPVCSAILKPDVILFGEQLPYKTLETAQHEVNECDLILVAGSSLEVLPVAAWPIKALDHGAHLIIINNTPTYLNVRADVVISSNVADVVPAIVESVIHGI